jgi:hypothetical protein
MAKKSFVVGMLAFTLVFGLILAGCGGSSALAGKWVPEEAHYGPGGDGSMELSKDGTGIANGVAITWKVEKGRLVLKHDLQGTFSFAYKLSGASLTLTNDDGESVRYYREKK